MVKVTLSVFIAALLPALALASDSWDIESRAVTGNDIFGRELSETEAIIFARDIEELFARLPQGLSQDDANDLVGRNPSKAGRGFMKFLNGALSIIKREDDQEVFAREGAELNGNDLVRREPSKAGRGFMKVLNGALSILKREDDQEVFAREGAELNGNDLVRREPSKAGRGFMKFLNGALSILKREDDQEVFAREGELNGNDLVGRTPSKAGRGFMKFLSFIIREDPELDAREPDYLGAKDELLGRGLYDELDERDLEDELYLRELSGWDIDELD